MVTELSLQVLIDEKLQGLVEDAISFETGLSREQAADPSLYAYEHHGVGFTQVDPGALTSFFEDMLRGRPLPLKFATKVIGGVDTLTAITLFLHRDLCIHPQMPSFISQVELTHRLGLPAFGHVDHELARFFRMLLSLFATSLTKREEGERLQQAVSWIHDYVANGILPHLGKQWEDPEIISVGSNGFALAEIPSDLHAGWVSLFRQGYLRGAVFAESHVLAGRKSVYVDFNVVRAAEALNDLEGGGWAADELWLHSPPNGTRLPREHIIEVLLRI